MNGIHPVGNGEEDFYIELMDKYGEELARLSYTYVKDYQIAEDIVQDVFMKLYMNKDKFRGESSYKTYLFRITINCCYDYLRSAAYKKSKLLTTLTNMFKGAEHTEDLIIKKTENYMVGQEILSLPLKDREIIILYYYKDLSMVEIADLFNISLNTVKSRLFRARTKLKDKLKGENFNESK
ncbi:RNA polymerase sigma factor [Sutcliffiella rhizosphaerae]|uniref:ECF RNA polymerase sigma factor SigW n=1 Tax=Sutcliffiella rhizosphaerae TaxID=2880967 RepID=A0ABM8YKA5_9BACI|nr:sigma-70 family RNA polymerase sigma factor [Sutcliffiella rhizosphaerae]CAG9620360.1 ECF RNA polymerase sigma factor SigW [Sutcliffiella rhizosphaerae]